MERRKFLIGMGSLAAGSAAAIGTSAFRGSNVEAPRSMNVGLSDDGSALLELEDTSPYASYSGSNSGGIEQGHGIQTLDIDVSDLNADADTRLNDVFRIKNTTGHSVDLSIHLSNADGANPGSVRVYADDGSTETELWPAGWPGSTPPSMTLGAGEEVEINLLFAFKDTGFNSLPDGITIDADGAS